MPLWWHTRSQHQRAFEPKGTRFCYCHNGNNKAQVHKRRNNLSLGLITHNISKHERLITYMVFFFLACVCVFFFSNLQVSQIRTKKGMTKVFYNIGQPRDVFVFLIMLMHGRRASTYKIQLQVQQNRIRRGCNIPRSVGKIPKQRYLMNNLIQRWM